MTQGLGLNHGLAVDDPGGDIAKVDVALTLCWDLMVVIAALLTDARILLGSKFGESVACFHFSKYRV